MGWRLILMKNLLFAINFISLAALADVKSRVERIQSLRFDIGQVQKMYLAPGLGSIVIFPCALQEVFVGRGEDLKAQISPNDKKTLFLNLKLNSSLPTNVIAKCYPEKIIFVFDVIPNRDRHQDLFEIRSSFGRPQLVTENRNQHFIAEKTSVRRVVQSPILIEKGGQQ